MSEDEYRPHNRLIEYFKELDDEILDAGDEGVEREGLEGSLDDVPVGEDLELAGGTATIESYEVNSFERVKHEAESEGMRAVEYVQKYFQTPSFTTEIAANAFQRDLGEYWKSVFSRNPDRDDIGFLCDLFFAMVVPGAEPRPHRWEGSDGHYKRAIRALVDAYDAPAPLFTPNLERARTFVRYAIQECDEDDRARFQRTSDDLDRYVLLLSRCIDDEGLEILTSVHMREYIESNIVDDLGAITAAGRLVVPDTALPFYTRAVLTASNPCNLYDSEKKKLELGMIVAIDADEKQQLDAAWVYQEAVDHMVDAIVSRPRRKTARALKRVRASLGLCSAVEEDVRVAIVRSLGDGVAACKALLGVKPLPQKNVQLYRKPANAPLTNRHVYVPPRNYQRRRGPSRNR